MNDEPNLFDLADVHTAESMDKVALAQQRFSLHAVTHPGDPAFDEAYRAMDAFFGPRGELERRETLQNLLREPECIVHENYEIRYHVVVARDGGGELAGVRDCFVIMDAAARVCLVFLSHAIVLPPYRRSGLAVMMRSFPATLGRRAAARRFGSEGAADLMLAAEMEPIAPSDPDTVVRLLAYGRSGFSVIAPDYLPYLQPDFRDLKAPGVVPQPVPLLAVIRWMGHENEEHLPGRLALAYSGHIHGVHDLYVASEHIQALRRHTEGTLGGRDPVPMVRIPPFGASLAGLAPLLRSVVLPLYPPAFRGSGEPLGDPVVERAALESMPLRAPQPQR